MNSRYGNLLRNQKKYEAILAKADKRKPTIFTMSQTHKVEEKTPKIRNQFTKVSSMPRNYLILKKAATPNIGRSIKQPKKMVSKELSKENFDFDQIELLLEPSFQPTYQALG